ncbi:unnamed protein product [Paramecium primaurelia]|uniref:Uncharacterized protein n=1 Tax=Paramecium primaurelia TaxID=5886 RepID=A0A8S1KRF9_PARPR|nr:unnamed protein product [Paramecium primaurelia]
MNRINIKLILNDKLKSLKQDYLKNCILHIIWPKDYQQKIQGK